MRSFSQKETSFKLNYGYERKLLCLDNEWQDNLYNFAARLQNGPLIEDFHGKSMAKIKQIWENLQKNSMHTVLK